MAFCQSKGEFEGDGWRYLQNARNLLHGYLAGPETLMFWNGPGYPLTLVPFVAFGIPLPLAHLANALFLYLAMAHFQGALRSCGIEKRSLAYAYGMGILLFLHGPLLGMIMSESLSAFLACGAAWHFCRAARPDGTGRQAAAAGAYLGGLALTKVFFGYALEVSLAISLAAWAWARVREGTSGDPGAGSALAAEGRLETLPAAQAAAVAAVQATTVARAAATACAVGLLVCAPYLAHTWSKTGKANFWGNSGGYMLYCMSLPEAEYRGDWLNPMAVLEHPEFFRAQVGFIGETWKLDALAQDGVFKRAALRNCREHPGKCFRNWRANVNRMVFGFPVTPYPGSDPELSTGNRAFVYAFPFFLLLILAVPGLMARGFIPAGVHFCLAFACMSLGGLSLLSAIPRQAFPLLPLMGLWCVVALENAIRIRGRSIEGN